MDQRTRRLVQERAQDRCEYCRLPAAYTQLPFQLDHVISLKHGGDSDPANLAWSCFDCNVFKGPNVAGVDPATRAVTPLYHPRKDFWELHFRWTGSTLEGLTPCGRATIDALRINLPVRVERRRLLSVAGVV